MRLKHEQADLRLDKMRTSDKVIARQLKDPHVRSLGDSSSSAPRTPSPKTALARQLGMKQPAVARLEAGEHNPSFGTRARLSSALGIEFHIAVTPSRVAM